MMIFEENKKIRVTQCMDISWKRFKFLQFYYTFDHSRVSRDCIVVLETIFHSETKPNCGNFKRTYSKNNRASF